MTNIESMDYTHSHPSTIASLSSTAQLSLVHYTHHIASLKRATIPSYYGIFIAIPRYIAMQLPPFRLMTCATTSILPLHDRKIASMMFPWLVHFLMSLLC